MTLRWPSAAAVALAGALGVLAPSAFGAWAGIPEPTFHDEFSYLLGADTFAQGRLTNTRPEFPEFFEAPHILVEPTYASKYPPAQSIVLAAGQILGKPIFGVWLSCGLFAASLCWMLQAWVSRKWAIILTALEIATLGTTTYWAQSYWGGMVGATGGALLLGGLRRTLRRPRIFSSVLMACGVLLLANSRPFEGVLLCAPPAWFLGKWLWTSRLPRREKMLGWAVPFGAVLAAGAACILFYNRAVTGSPWQAPYSLHVQQYLQRSVFIFGSAQKPTRESISRVTEFYKSEEAFPVLPPGGLSVEVLSNGFFRVIGGISTAFGLVRPPLFGHRSYIGGLLFVCLLFAVWLRLSFWPLVSTALCAAAGEILLLFLTPYYPILLWLPSVIIWTAAFIGAVERIAWSRFVWLSLVLVVAGQSVVWWWMAHYSSPITPLILGGVAMTVGRIARSPRGLGRSPAAPGVLLVVLLGVHVATLSAVSAIRGRPQAYRTASLRRQLVENLEKLEGRDLVFVRYAPDYSVHVEWVYNRADLSSASVIFAHDLGDERNRVLTEALADRRVWRASVSWESIRLEPMESTE